MNFSWKKPWEIPLALQLVSALFIGCVVGLLIGPRASVFTEVGTLIIKLLKALAAPLVFFAIVDAFCKTEIRKLQGLKLLLISTTNAAVAFFIALGVSYGLPIRRWVDFESLSKAVGIQPGEGANIRIPEFSFKAFLNTVVPSNIAEPFINNNVVAIVFLSLLVGITIRSLKGTRIAKKELLFIENFIAGGFNIISKALGLVVRLTPIAAFAIIAKVVGTSGFKVFAALGVFVTVVTLGLLIHVVIYYSILLVVFAKKSPLLFFRQGSEALVTAFSTGSSLATLPVTLRTLNDKMKISPASSRLAACVGTNLNHDGILLYEAVAALFIAQMQGATLTLSQQVTLGLTSVLAAIGIAGVPDAGFITLSLVVGSVGLPFAAVPLLLPVDWFIGRLRATTNVASDMIVATLLDK